MNRTDVVVASTLALLGALVIVPGCSSEDPPGQGNTVVETNPTCMNGLVDGDETGIDCGGACVSDCSSPLPDGGPRTGPDGSPVVGPNATNGVKDADETDVDCGGAVAAKCAEGKSCLVDQDCEVGCNYAKKCVSAPSCKTHLGGDTCGKGEVDEPGTQHESCCRTLPVPGYTDASHPGKTVYLDKYEITAGRVRAFIEQLAAANGGVPDVKSWILANRPEIWDDAWNVFLPSGVDGDVVTIARRLLGDPRPEDNGETGNPGPGVILPPATDQPRHMGTNYQFGSEVYVDLHGNNCGTYANTYGFPTFWYPDDVLARDGQLPRASGLSLAGQTIAAKDLLDVKSMNCITNAMLAAFCAWDGGQLATDEVLDFVTETPATLGNVSGCGTQYDNHGDLLKNDFSRTVQSGGKCASVSVVNATFDAGDALPVANSPLNVHNYHYPDLGNQTHDKAWEIAAPGRASTAAEANFDQADVIRINPTDEPWLDLNGNVNEAALDVSGGTFSGKFALKFRGIGYGSARSDLNMKPVKGEDVLRLQRPEAKAAYTGGRCMRFR